MQLIPPSVGEIPPGRQVYSFESSFFSFKQNIICPFKGDNSNSNISGDGTVRWHRLSDGDELLALFVHPDGKRWVVWTPQGYYDAAPGADRLIGWHVDRGPDQAADFYAAAQFQERFYRPAVIAQVLKTLDVAEAVRLTETAVAKTAPAPSLATTESGQTSQPATLNLRWRSAVDAFKPTLYVLAIVVRKYKTYDPLKFADRDAQEFIKRIQQQKGQLYKDVQVKPLLNEQADGRTIKQGFDWIRRQTTQHDVAIVFISGHGINDHQGEYYLLPHDVEASDLFSTGIPKSEIHRVLKHTAGKLVIFFDTCYAGGAQSRNIKGGSQADIHGVVNELTKAGQGAVVFASSTGNQVSVELDEFRHGAFTKALLEGLDGKADYTKDSFISTDELALFVSQRVKNLTKGDQMPTTVKPETTPDLRLFVTPD